MITDYSWGAGERSKPEYEPAAIPGRFAQLVLCAWFLDAAYLYGKISHKHLRSSCVSSVFIGTDT